MMYFLIVCVVCVLIFAKMALVIIPQSETKIIERLGRYHGTLDPGIAIIIPFIDKAKEIVGLKEDNERQCSDGDRCTVVFSDSRPFQGGL